MRICACCNLPSILTYPHGRRDYCKSCYDKKQFSVDIQWAFGVAFFFLFCGFLLGWTAKPAHAEIIEVENCNQNPEAYFIAGCKYIAYKKMEYGDDKFIFRCEPNQIKNIEITTYFELHPGFNGGWCRGECCFADIIKYKDRK